ncbi:SP0191 family lipoprotein [Streptococcus ovuberis]|uniref:DUF1307 domain-containing protein n=1 Tax=Streptococcus ovuberis TaxID=1936207 RepID=A0A7X6N1W2_9STRE|nr:SP0191 family lipoprotein [Streptococcus ovuberis]NKZ21431.1 DUF1307 domain-containing protein [Streptococcus ovuberis]
MKKYRWLLLAMTAICLSACGTKETKPAKEETTQSSEESVLKTQVFDLALTNGKTQRQTVLYKGDVIQKIILRNPMEVTEEIKQAISEVGLEETKRLLLESMGKDDVYQQLAAISGLSYEVDFLDENQFFITFTLDVPNLETNKLAQLPMFKGSGLEDVSKLTSEQYLERLAAYGAQPVVAGEEESSDSSLFTLEKE